MNQSPERSVKDYAVIALKGLGMGAADIVPGVSGGTIAFITGIYDELLHSLKSITPAVLLTLFQRGFKAAWQQINGNFLLALFAGVLISIKVFAALIGAALQSFPVLVWSFFFGLILSSIYIFAKQQAAWRSVHWACCAMGVAIVVSISMVAPAQLPGTWWIMFLGGFVAICAMILPGVSGSFILMLVGLYSVLIAAVNDMNVVLLSSFLMGCVGGLLVFSRFLSWLLDHYHKATFAVLIGFLVGSLKVIWPWKYTVSYFENSYGEAIPLEQRVVFPADFERLTGSDAMLLLAILASLTGILLVLLVDFVSRKINK